MPDHPKWCDRKRCTVGKDHYGYDARRDLHKGRPAEVGGVMIWPEQSPNGEPVVAFGRYRLSPRDTARVVEAMQQVLASLSGAPR
jgi:hypothetical protein